MTLVCIQAYQGARHIVKRHWKYYGGKDKVGVLPENTENVWPNEIPTCFSGKDSYIDGCILPKRLVDTFAFCATFEGYTDYLVIEYDSLILGTIPQHQGGLHANIMGPCPPKWKVNAKWFLHPPWWADKATAFMIAEHGNRAIEQGKCENGSPDVFLGWLCDHCKIPYSNVPGLTYSTNNRDMRIKLEEARKVVGAGGWFVHGVIEQDQFDTLLGARPPTFSRR